jgi:putative hydrolase of the HAD superfamily
MQKPKAILFDLDDTLIDRHAIFTAFSELFVRDNFPSATGEQCSLILERLRRLDDNGNAHRPELFYRLCREESITMPPEKQLIDCWNTKFPECMVPMEGMHELLRRLKALHIKLALVTNGNRVLQNNKIDQAGIRGYFDTILISDEFAFEKPDTRIFSLAVSRLGVAANEALFIGDNLINDISGAQHAGIHDCWINHFDVVNTTGVNPSAEIKSLGEITKIAAEW